MRAELGVCHLLTLLPLQMGAKNLFFYCMMHVFRIFQSPQTQCIISYWSIESRNQLRNFGKLIFIINLCLYVIVLVRVVVLCKFLRLNLQ